MARTNVSLHRTKYTICRRVSRLSYSRHQAIRPQASFIVWLDCTRLHLEHDALIDLFVDKARLALNDGEMFGPEGKGHMRLNVGTPRAVLQKALEQLRSAVDGLKR